jgi:hypothetical protein
VNARRESTTSACEAGGVGDEHPLPLEGVFIPT